MHLWWHAIWFLVWQLSCSLGVAGQRDSSGSGGRTANVTASLGEGIPFVLLNNGNAFSRNHHTGAVFTEVANGQWCGGAWSTIRKNLGELDLATCAEAVASEHTCQPLFFHIVNSSSGAAGNGTTCGCVLRAQECIFEGPDADAEASVYTLAKQAMFTELEGIPAGYYCSNGVDELQTLTGRANESSHLCADFVQNEPNCSDVFHFGRITTTGERLCACLLTNATCSATDGSSINWAGKVYRTMQGVNSIRFGSVLPLDYSLTDITRVEEALRNHSEAVLMALRAVAQSPTFANGFSIGHRQRPVELLLAGIDFRGSAREASRFLMEANITFLIAPADANQAEDMAVEVMNFSEEVLMIAPIGSTALAQDRSRVFALEVDWTALWDPTLASLSASFEALDSEAVECRLAGDSGAIPRALAIIYEEAFKEMCLGALEMATAWGMEVPLLLPVTLDNISVALEILSNLTNPEGDAANRTVSAVIACVEEPMCTTTVENVNSTGALVLPLCAAQPRSIDKNGADWFMTSAATFWTWGSQRDNITGWNMTDFVAMTTTPPSIHGLASLTAFTVVMEAVQERNTLDVNKVKEHLYQMSYDSLLGTVEFDDEGIYEVPAKLVQHLEVDFSYPKERQIPTSSVNPTNLTDLLAFPLPSKEFLFCYIGGDYGFTDEDECVICDAPLVPRPVNSQDAEDLPCLTGTQVSRQRCSPCRPQQRYVQPLESVTDVPLCTNIASCPVGQEGIALSGGELLCSNCSVGRFETYGTCDACPLGKFAGREGSSACQDCEAGRFANQKGLSACEGCPGGSASAAGAFSCLICQPGAVSLPDSPVCDRCLAGSVAPVEGMTACVDCEAGRFSVWEADNCESCAAGEYQYLPGQSLCLSISNAMIPSGNLSYGTNRQRYWTRYYNGSLDREGCRFTPKACEPHEKCIKGTTGVHCAQCIPGYSIRKFSGVEEDSPCFECQAAWWNITITILAIFGRAFCAVLLASVSISILSHPSCVILPLSRLALLYIAYLGAFVFCFLQVFEERLAGETSTLFPALATYTAAAMLNWCYGMPFLETELWSIKCLIQSSLPDLAERLTQVITLEWFSDANAANIEALKDEARMVQIVFTIIMGLWPAIVGGVAYLGCLISFNMYLWRWRDYYSNSLDFYEDLKSQGFHETLRIKTDDGQKKWDEPAWTAYLHEYSYRWVLWRPLDHIEHREKRRGIFLVKLHRFTRDSWPIFVAIFLLSYNSALLGVIEPLQCITLGADSVRRIRTASILHCFDFEEELVLTVMALAWLFWWGLAFPAIVVRYLRRRRHKLASEVAMRRWGMLTDGLQNRCYWWEAYIFGTKLCLLLIVFLTPQYSGRNKNLFLLCWSIAYAFILTIFMPHDDRCHDVLMALDARFVKIWVLGCLFLEMESLFSNEISTLVLILAIAALHLWFLFAAIRLFLEHVIIALAVSSDFHMILEHNERAVAAGYRLRSWVVLLQKIVLRTHRWLQRHSAYVSVDPLSCWVTISGNRADIAKPPTVIRGVDHQPNIPEMSEAPTVPQEPHVKEATRQQREQLIGVLSRTMKHVALSAQNATFSVSLFEFVVRAGFWQACLHQHGYTRHKVHHPADSKQDMPREVSQSSHNVAVQIDDQEVANLLDIDHHTPGAYVLACERPKRRYALWAHLRAVSASQPGHIEEVMKGPGLTASGLREQLMHMEAMIARTMYEDRADEVIEQLLNHGVIEKDADYDDHPAMTMINADRAWEADRKALLRQVLGWPVARQKLKENKEKVKQMANDLGLPKYATQASLASRESIPVSPKKRGFTTHSRSIQDVELDPEGKQELLEDMFSVATFKHGVGLDDLQVALMDIQRLPADELVRWLDQFEEAWLRHNRVTAYNMRYFTKQVFNAGVLTGSDLLPAESRRLWHEEKRSREVEASIATYMHSIPDPDAPPPVIERSTQVPSVRSTTELNLQKGPLLWARICIALCGGFWRFRISHLTSLADHRVKAKQKELEDENNKEKRICEMEMTTRHDIEETVLDLRNQFEKLCLELRTFSSAEDS